MAELVDELDQTLLDHIIITLLDSEPDRKFSKPIVSIHVCCSYIELSRSKLHKTGRLGIETLIANILVHCCSA